MTAQNSLGAHCCDGVTRREFLQIGGLSAFGLAFPQLALAGTTPSAGTLPFGKAKRCILLFMVGGPPQQDTFDLKPDAPAEIRGAFKPIKTNVSGVEISEYFPLLAKHADKYAILRSVTHDSNIHTVGAHYMLSGNAYPKPAAGEIGASSSDHPHYGSVLAKLHPAPANVPNFVALPQKTSNTDGTVWPSLGGGFLGSRFDPLQVNAEYEKYKSDVASYENRPFRVPSLSLPTGMTGERLQERRRLLEALERSLHGAERTAKTAPRDPYRAKAFDLLSSNTTQRAFQLDMEPVKTRDRYGRHLFGQGCLLARRLVEAGVPLVTVYWHPDGTPAAPSWDTHEKHYTHLKNHLMTPCDVGFSALLEDLHQRGMLDSTLVIWMGEFGRTPQINGAGGRDHWGMCQSVVMAGGGVQGGRLVGKSDRIAAYPAENPISPGDLGATLYSLMGISPETEIHDPFGRPLPLVRGEPIAGLF